MRKLFDKLYKKSAQSFYEILSDNLKNNKKTFVVTANPETFMISEKNEDVRKMLLDKQVSFNIISPTQNKKFATGNGSADKSLMIDAWKRLDTHIKDIDEIKIDDLADAYFLSRFEFSA